jgi:hypothetical protein
MFVVLRTCDVQSLANDGRPTVFTGESVDDVEGRSLLDRLSLSVEAIFDDVSAPLFVFISRPIAVGVWAGEPL